MKRECGTCNKCCEGWLTGEAHGKPFWPGRPCHFLTAGKCGIYKTRPDSPCKSYHCLWLVDEEVPGWMKPDEVNAILTVREVNGTSFLDLTEAGEKLRSEVLSWAVMFALGKNANLRYQIAGGSNRIGSQEFLAAVG